MSEFEEVFEFLKNKSHYLSQWPELQRATADNDTPTPGYLLPIIAKLSFHSGVQCKSLSLYFEDRLKVPSCSVKVKTLKLIIFLLEKGHKDFKKYMQKSLEIDKATKFSGPPDPLHGNAPYELTRKLAKEAQELIFSDNFVEDEKDRSVDMFKTSYPGLGSTNVSNSSYSGFGNTVLDKKSISQSISEGVLDLAEKLKGKLEGPEERHKFEPTETVYFKPLPLPAHTYCTESTIESSAFDQLSSREFIPGKALGGWGDDETEEDTTEEVVFSQNELEESTSSKQDREETILVQNFINRDMLPTLQEIRSFNQNLIDKDIGIVLQEVNSQLQNSNCSSVSLMSALLIVEFIIREENLPIDKVIMVLKEGLNYIIAKTNESNVYHKTRKIILILQNLSNEQFSTSERKLLFIHIRSLLEYIIQSKSRLFSTTTEAPLESQQSNNGENTEKTQVDDVEKKFEEEKTKLMAQVKDVEDKYKRSLAEMENVRNRLTKQIADAKVFGIQSFCKDLLEVADILNSATAAVPKEALESDNQHLKSLFDGLTMTDKQLRKVFTRHGLEPIDPAKGEKFDPNLHEALFQAPITESETPGSVAVVTKTGYRLHERTIRPALVGVYNK
ncbi:DgyrCDS8361 [Dimorphilus gyrociliatus]|uniref:GrpE protein homolog n=1 Tax=Dimorphilus gyrociliatus TaxID=2664684 RepID=A0A7I8VUV9_9ANNE|nr:DgyrCDS8361 [Dimorphilus gyrociliatus]